MAERELGKLKQANREFSAYFADFQRIQANLRWTIEAQRALLLQGISEELQDLLLCYDAPDGFNDLVALLQRLDVKLCARDALRKAKTAKPTTTRPSTTTSSAPSYATAPERRTERRTDNPAYLGPAPMDLAAQR